MIRDDDPRAYVPPPPVDVDHVRAGYGFEWLAPLAMLFVVAFLCWLDGAFK